MCGWAIGPVRLRPSSSARPRIHRSASARQAGSVHGVTPASLGQPFPAGAARVSRGSCSDDLCEMACCSPLGATPGGTASSCWPRAGGSAAAAWPAAAADSCVSRRRRRGRASRRPARVRVPGPGDGFRRHRGGRSECPAVPCAGRQSWRCHTRRPRSGTVCAEREAMRSHAELGAEALSEAGMNVQVVDAVRPSRALGRRRIIRWGFGASRSRGRRASCTSARPGTPCAGTGCGPN